MFRYIFAKTSQCTKLYVERVLDLSVPRFAQDFAPHPMGWLPDLKALGKDKKSARLFH